MSLIEHFIIIWPDPVSTSEVDLDLVVKVTEVQTRSRSNW